MASTEPDVVDVSMDDEDVATLLGENLVNTILEGGSLDSIKKLLDDGAPVWYQNEAEGTSPLHAAAYMRNPQLAKLLIEKGAVWNAGEFSYTRDREGETEQACWSVTSGLPEKHRRRHLTLVQRFRNLHPHPERWDPSRFVHRSFTSQASPKSFLNDHI
jgi:hypothetical protein